MMILDEILNINDLVFDIGANVGIKTELFLKYNVKVICIEPQKDCLIDLAKKFCNNNNIIIVPTALSSDGSPRMFRISDASTLSTFSENFVKETGLNRFKNYNWNSPIEIKTDTLDDIIKIYGIPKFCKIDVEGSETEVLKGLSYQIPYISFEYTPELNINAIECMNVLSILGKYVYRYSEGETLIYNNDTWLNKDNMLQYLLLNKMNIDFGDIYAKLDIRGKNE